MSRPAQIYQFIAVELDELRDINTSELEIFRMEWTDPTLTSGFLHFVIDGVG